MKITKKTLKEFGISLYEFSQKSNIPYSSISVIFNESLAKDVHKEAEEMIENKRKYLLDQWSENAIINVIGEKLVQDLIPKGRIFVRFVCQI